MSLDHELAGNNRSIGAMVDELRPFSIVSIWRLMKIFDAGKLFGSIVGLSNLAHRLAGIHHLGDPVAQPVPLRVTVRNHEIMKDEIDFICAELERLDLPMSLKSARELRCIIWDETAPFDREDPPGSGRSVLFPPLAASRYWTYTNDLSVRLEDELSAKTTMVLPHSKVGYYDGSSKTFSQAVRDSFPSAERDMNEVGKCFALDRHTACVFHLMRVMEAGLNALSKDLSVPIGKNWNTALDMIEKEIRSRSVNTHGQQWKINEPFYSGVATHFRFVKNAWRNYAAHLHEHYDEEDASIILNNVSAFMRDLAVKLHE